MRRLASGVGKNYLGDVDEGAPDVLILVVDVCVQRSHDDPREEHQHDDLPGNLANHAAELGVEISLPSSCLDFLLVDVISSSQDRYSTALDGRTCADGRILLFMRNSDDIDMRKRAFADMAPYPC